MSRLTKKQYQERDLEYSRRLLVGKGLASWVWKLDPNCSDDWIPKKRTNLKDLVLVHRSYGGWYVISVDRRGNAWCIPCCKDCLKLLKIELHKLHHTQIVQYFAADWEIKAICARYTVKPVMV